MATVPKKKLQMRFATREDAPRIAEIHMAAFKHNTMLHAQFPTPAVRRGLQVAIENKALADIDDPKASVLVVTSSEGKAYFLLSEKGGSCVPRPCVAVGVDKVPSRRILFPPARPLARPLARHTGPEREKEREREA